MRIQSLLIKGLIAIAFAFSLWGCSKTNNSAPTIDATGKHPAGWAVAGIGGAHPGVYLASPGQCEECHGKDLRGGISRVSCFSASFAGITCHPAGPSGHPVGWDNPDLHGVSAKAPVVGINGFSFCQRCHGTDFSGGIVNVSCYSCHGVLAPHSPQPWLSIAGRTHTNTDPSNASACAVCHTAGANLAPAKRLPSYVSGTPGCFNSTLCHGVVGHAVGWADPGQHGAAAKAASPGIGSCRTCHGSDFHGSGTIPSCFACHTTAPHSAAPWRIATLSPSTHTHKSTDPANVAVCALCHLGNQRLTTPLASLPGGTTPGCFNNTLCHAVVGHPIGWNDPTQHGTTAKQAPGAASGFNYCQNCHGPAFNGGLALTSCINNAGCHGAAVASPHSPTPWLGGARTHITTNQGNAVTCSACHTAGANLTTIPLTKYGPYAVGAAGCFNNTLCHPNLGDCTGCHSSQQPSTGPYRRVVVGAGGVSGGDFALTSHHIKTLPVSQASCDVCHDQSNHQTFTNGVSVLLTNQDTGTSVTYNGTNTGTAESFCVSCHDGNGAPVQGSNSTKPFADSSDTTFPPNVGWAVGAMAHSSKMACFNCHGNSAGTLGNTLNPLYNGHGSATPKLLQYTYNGAAPSTFCYNCHGTTVNPNGNGSTINVQAPFSQTFSHSSQNCNDCHNVHQARPGTHNAGTNAVSGVLRGVTGSLVTFPATNWTTPAPGAYVSGTATTEYQICFKCHANGPAGGGAGAASWTDLGLEFNPNNMSGHPVVASLNNYPNSLLQKALATARMTASWQSVGTQTMYCSDCHGNSSAGALGPHGSTIKWMLVGTNKAWPYTSAASNGTSTGTFFTYAGRTTNQGTDNGLFCLNCHNLNTNPHSSDSAHTGIPCVNCHIRVPHGGKVSRLIATDTAGLPARYKPDGNGGAFTGGRPTQFRKANAGSYSESNCQQTGCGGHGTVTTPETW